MVKLLAVVGVFSGLALEQAVSVSTTALLARQGADGASPSLGYLESSTRQGDS